MSSEPDWNLYRSFAAVMREGSLSAAARSLGLAQPSVARHIDALEAATGAKLFLRTQRGLSPTDAALRLKPHAEALVITSAALLRAVTDGADAVSGTVRISASEVVGVEHLPPILAELRRRYPMLQLELVLSNKVDDLLGRQADIAVRMTEPVQQALVTRRIGSVAVGLHAHRSYLDRRGVPATMEELADHDLIGFDAETPAIRALAGRFPTLHRGLFGLRADSDLAQLAAIRAGFGIGFCQVQVARRSPDLARLLEQACSIDLGLWIVMHEDLRGSPSCRAVFNALVSGLAPLADRPL
jgi:DNA-binding transcriptional LysR family regulator